MSRRKQANPRPIQVFEGKNGLEEDISNKNLEQKETKMESLRPLNVNVSMPSQFHFNFPSSLSNSEDGMSRIASPSENPSMLTSPSTPSSSSSLPTSDQPLPKLKDASKILPVPGTDGRSTYICPMCQEQLQSNHDLTVHIRMHNSGNHMNQNNTCTICSKILSSQSSLDRHMLVHSGERPFKCKICAMTFTTNGNMHRHSRIHQKNAAGGANSPRPSKRSKGGWKGKLFPSSSVDDADMDLASERTTPTTPDESKDLSKSSAASLDWTRDLQKNNNLPKPKMMPEFMPRPMWPTYTPYMPFMRPQFSSVFPEMSMGMFPFQQIPCPLCSKQVHLMEYMSHLKTEHHHENPFITPPSPAMETNSIKEEPTTDSEEKSGDVSDDQSENERQKSEGSDESEVSSTSSPKPVTKGFEDINFMDFTSPKFPLVAKTWCEQNESDTVINTQDFNCRECGKAFPCKSSLMLHTESHLESRSLETSEAQTDESPAGNSGEKMKKGFFSLLNLKPNQMVSSSDEKVCVEIENCDEECNSSITTSPNDTRDTNQQNHSNNVTSGFTPFNVSSQPFTAQRGMLHADSPLAVSTSPASSILSGEGSSGDLHDGKATGLLCKFCDMVFPNPKTLNAHKRIHMGLTPYKCSMCSYSSADKSTLIRHFRTHNGERPFQCTICDYAFTTKANCERHVRKKHDKSDKVDIEKSIGYNKFTSADRQMNSFHSPDTVCKYCGEDFKFFRALKHHLRSHSSCRLKPFLCQRCQVGFSTKANCVRHIQKQHTDIDQNDVEQFIKVNESNMDVDSDSSQSDNNSTCEKTPAAKVPPQAHSSTIFDYSPVMGENLLKHMMRKVESPPDFIGQGLNFKFISSQCLDTSFTNDEPMDLSVKREIVSPEDKKITLEQTEISPNLGYNCPYCLRSFAVSTELRIHVQQVHDITPEKDTNNNRKCLQETSTPRKLPIMPYPIHPAFVKYNPYPSQAMTALFSPGGFDVTSDLSPVNIMLTAAHSQNFPSFLAQPAENSPFKPFTTSSIDSNVDYDNDIDNIGCDSDNYSDDDSSDKTDTFKSDILPRLDNSVDFRPCKSLELSDPTTKKKRNSYADSPHKLACPYCPRSFPWVSSLNRHLLTHTGQKPFKCSQCPVTFSTKSNRERHLIRKHGVNMLDPASRSTMDRPYKCHLCVFSSFATKSNLLKHYSDRHPGCPLPDQLYRWDESDNAEQQIVTEETADVNSTDNSAKLSDDEADEEKSAFETIPPYFAEDKEDVIAIKPCDEEPTHQMSALSDDEEVVNNNYHDTSTEPTEKHINPERDNYNVDKIRHCWKCGEEFMSRKILVRHLKEHNIDLPYKCYLCDASFDSRLDCLKHKEKNHASDWSVLHEKNGVKNLDEFAYQIDYMVSRSSAMDCEGENKDMRVDLFSESTRADVLTADYFQRKVYCSLCPKRFWSLQDLRRHMRSHTGERPFECDICHKRFTLKHSMMRHRRKHGNIADPNLLSDDTESFFSDEPTGGNVFVNQLPRLVDLPFTSSNVEKRNIKKSHHNVSAEDNQSEGETPDILHNLLGVETSDIDTMLDLKNSLDSTSQLLGISEKDAVKP